ncbi:MAG: SagB/ThcOx family dehydrogenase [Anaerolineae bacterium]
MRATRREVLLMIIFGLLGCQPPIERREVMPSPVGEIPLPTPGQRSEVSLEEALARRRSMREFREEGLSWAEISGLLWAGQGVTDSRGFRTAPSAGALYPLELYVVTGEGVYHYLPQSHRLAVLSLEDMRLRLWEVGLKQDALREAPAIIVIAAVYARTEAKYGPRAERYVRLEAGHAAQNILLQATALDLGAVPIGAFYDQKVQEVLALPSDHEPLYLIPVGHPR